MINVTNQDVVRRALEVLGVIGSGQPTPAEDFEKVFINMQGAVSWLAERRVVDLESEIEANEIPAQFFDPLSMIVASKVAPAYGLGGEMYINLKALADQAEREIAQMRPYSWRKQPATAEYF